MEPDYTVELFKRDSRTKLGERLVAKLDHKVTAREHLEVEYAALYPAAKGYRFTINQTFVTRKNLLSGRSSKSVTIHLASAHPVRKPTGQCKLTGLLRQPCATMRVHH